MVVYEKIYLKHAQMTSALPNIKYNCVILFLCEICWSFVYASKYISHRPLL